MKPFLFPLVPVSALMTVNVEDLPFLEKIFEKWGIGFIGMALFVGLAYWASKRDAKAQSARDKREAADHSERVELAKKNNELTEQLIKQTTAHSIRLEQIIEKSNIHQECIGEQLRAISRFQRCPHVLTTPQE